MCHKCEKKRLQAEMKKNSCDCYTKQHEDHMDMIEQTNNAHDSHHVKHHNKHSDRHHHHGGCHESHYENAMFAGSRCDPPLVALPGPTGATGPAGATGATGAPGAPGATGATPSVSVQLNKGTENDTMSFTIGNNVHRFMVSKDVMQNMQTPQVLPAKFALQSQLDGQLRVLDELRRADFYGQQQVFGYQYAALLSQLNVQSKLLTAEQTSLDLAQLDEKQVADMKAEQERIKIQLDAQELQLNVSGIQLESLGAQISLLQSVQAPIIVPCLTTVMPVNACASAGLRDDSAVTTVMPVNACASAGLYDDSAMTRVIPVPEVCVQSMPPCIQQLSAANSILVIKKNERQDKLDAQKALLETLKTKLEKAEPTAPINTQLNKLQEKSDSINDELTSLNLIITSVINDTLNLQVGVSTVLLLTNLLARVEYKLSDNMNSLIGEGTDAPQLKKLEDDLALLKQLLDGQSAAQVDAVQKRLYIMPVNEIILRSRCTFMALMTGKVKEILDIITTCMQDVFKITVESVKAEYAKKLMYVLHETLRGLTVGQKGGLCSLTQLETYALVDPLKISADLQSEALKSLSNSAADIENNFKNALDKEIMDFTADLNKLCTELNEAKPNGWVAGTDWGTGGLA